MKRTYACFTLCQRYIQPFRFVPNNAVCILIQYALMKPVLSVFVGGMRCIKKSKADKLRNGKLQIPKRLSKAIAQGANRNRKLEISTAPTKVKSRKPAYSKTLYPK